MWWVYTTASVDDLILKSKACEGQCCTGLTVGPCACCDDRKGGEGTHDEGYPDMATKPRLTGPLVEAAHGRWAPSSDRLYSRTHPGLCQSELSPKLQRRQSHQWWR